MTEHVNLFDYSREGLTQLFSTWGEKPFRATQVFQWLHYHGIHHFDGMTNLSKALRQRLTDTVTLALPEILTEKYSQDGTYKWVMKLADGNCVETVFIPEDDRGTLCVSSQVGCALNCSFCSTGHQGFNRNLSVSEIIGQVWRAVRRLSTEGSMHDRHVTNIVMMGMGEPLLNFENVVTAMSIMRDDFGYGLSKRRVTLSTSGVVPMMRKLAQDSDVSLAVSLHAPNDALRDSLVPINKKYPLRELMAVCKEYFPPDSRRKITFEYVMLDGINDQPEQAKQLIQLMRGIPGKINLIPFNPFPQTHYQRSPLSAIHRFRDLLMEADLITTIRKTRGEDIDAACGQLTGSVRDKTRRQQQYRIQNIPLTAIEARSE